ncbi:MAG TPA: hypothetical protein VFH97_01590 [Gemmatimonadales bacterium]|nr:hypothetical protein [Gemmatimonadales bacterium]
MAQRVSRALPLLGAALLAAACGGGRQQAETAPTPALPLPTAGIAGQPVVVYPITLISAESSLRWDELLGPRRAALDAADSLLGEMLVSRSPEVQWVLPPALRRAAARAAGAVGDPDKMGTALLRSPALKQIPDPLRSQMRNLGAVAGDRYALVPASLFFLRTPDGRGRAELTLVIADIRTGLIEWRTIANAVGEDPWSALRDAIKTLTPGTP